MKTLVIGSPDALPPELADNPDVLVLDPETLPEELMAMLDEASGGMLMEDAMLAEGEEAPVDDLDADGMGGYGDPDEDEKNKGGGADDEEEDPIEGGEGPDEDEEERKKKEAEGGSGMRGGRGLRGGRGEPVPALSAWARSVRSGAR